MFHEAGRRYDWHLAALYISLVDNTAHATEVIEVRVRVDDGNYRTFAEFSVNQLQRGSGGLFACQRVEHNPASVAFDETDIGKIEAANLVYFTRYYLIEPVGHVQYRLAL